MADVAWQRVLSWLDPKDDSHRGDQTRSSHRMTAAQKKKLLSYFKKNPAQLKAEDADGFLPLHTTVTHQGGAHVAAAVLALLAAHKHAAAHQTKACQMPLYLALQKDIDEHSVAMLLALLAAHSQAAQHKTNGGWLPLHVAAARSQTRTALRTSGASHPSSMRTQKLCSTCKARTPLCILQFSINEESMA